MTVCDGVLQLVRVGMCGVFLRDFFSKRRDSLPDPVRKSRGFPTDDPHTGVWVLRAGGQQVLEEGLYGRRDIPRTENTLPRPSDDIPLSRVSEVGMQTKEESGPGCADVRPDPCSH